MPGALQAYLVNQAATKSWRRAAVLSFAPLVSDIPIVLLTALVLSFVPEWVLSIVQIIGGAFILYLAYRSLSGFLKSRNMPDNPAPASFGSAVVINLLNPNVYIYWGTISGPLFIQGWREFPPTGVLFLVFFYGTMIVMTNILILAVNRLSTLGNRIQRILQCLSVVFMAVMGVVQLSAGITRLF